MKVKPVMDALEARGADVVLVHTGQHYDEAMNDVFFRDLGIRRPDRHLGTGSGTHAEQTARVMVAFEPVVDEVAPDAVVVVGDVTSTLACGLVAARAGTLLAHVEAGLRSRDWSMPEEINRTVADRLSDYLLAPSPDAVDNLRAEGYREDQIHLVGNVMIDTLLANRERALASGSLERLGLTSGQYGLVTLHRPANVDSPETLARLVSALTKISEELPLILPAHPRAASSLREMITTDQVRLIPRRLPGFRGPGGRRQDRAHRQRRRTGGDDRARRPLHDTARQHRAARSRSPKARTSWPAATPRGSSRSRSTSWPSPPAPRCPELWDGHAGERIADVLLTGGSAETRLRPTDLANGPPARRTDETSNPTDRIT